jgi:hypothetical protein
MEHITINVSNDLSICKRYNEGDFSIGGKIRVVSNLLQIVSEIIQQFDLEMKESEKEYARIRPVIEYIEHNYMRKITIAELSTMVLSIF